MTRDSESPPSSAPHVQARTEERLQALKSEGEVLDARDLRLSRGRGLSFLLAAGGGFYGLFAPAPLLWASVGLAAAVFVTFVIQHARLSTKQFELQRRTTWCEGVLARSQLQATSRSQCTDTHVIVNKVEQPNKFSNRRSKTKISYERKRKTCFQNQK